MSVDAVLVQRLQIVYWPLWCRQIAEDRGLPRAQPRAEYATTDRDHSYDLGRVRHFVQELRAGRAIDPILIDTKWHGTHPLGPIIDDGHHRFIAAVIAKKRRIAADVGGVVHHRDWLVGKLPLRTYQEWS